jgi:hypothetical protein|tara:strand:+ start:1585 stop:1773 length:189 start_codon:yes stop_codon:yes gene_type:complete
MKESPIDSIIIDLILEHYNMLSLDHREPTLTDIEFDDIVKYAQEVYYKRIMEDTPVGIEGEA